MSPQFGQHRPPLGLLPSPSHGAEQLEQEEFVELKTLPGRRQRVAVRGEVQLGDGRLAARPARLAQPTCRKDLMEFTPVETRR